ncbi:MAG: hypothetical protein ABJ387_03475 [Balneola sp.]
MKVKQGQRYRVLPPKQSGRTVIGQGEPEDRYISKVGDVVVEDIYGDVLNASDNVDYPRGTNADYRHVRWIEKHPERFELIKKAKKEV